MPQLERDSPPASRVLTVVFLALALLGAIATITGLRLLLREGAASKAFVGPLLTGVVLLAVGLVMPVLIPRARARVRARQRLRAARPAEPWMWREDWASGRIPGGATAAPAGMWVFALFWTGMTSLAAWLFYNERSGEPAFYAVAIFPAVGILLLVVAARMTLQRRKYGRSHFVLTTNPGVIGRTLEGYVETAIAEGVPEGGVEVRLTCARRVTTGTGKRRSTSERTLWQDHVTVPPPGLARGFAGLRIPVAFAIPAGVRACDDSHPNDRVLWRLSVSAAMPGVDYEESFEVPVMRTATTPHGGTVFSGKPRVTVRAGVGMVVATAVCWAGTWYLFDRGIPIAPYFAAFPGLLFTAGTLVALFHRSSVTVEEGTVVIRHRILGLGPTRRFAAADVSRVFSEVVGEGNAQSWEVKIAIRAGQAYSAIAHMPTQLEADWAAQQIRTAIAGTRSAAF